jgi:hypothetical protein
MWTKTPLECQDTKNILNKQQYYQICEDISDAETDLCTVINSFDIDNFDIYPAYNILVDNLIDNNHSVTMKWNDNIGHTSYDTYDILD